MVLNDAHAANVEIGVAQSLGQMGDGAGFIGDPNEHCVFLDRVPFSVVQDVQRPFVLIHNERNHSDVVNFFGVEGFDVDFISVEGGAKGDGQTVVMIVICLIALRCCCDGEPECEACAVCFYEPLMMTNRFASETA